MKTILPSRLRPGDQVAIIAPAFKATEEQVCQATARLEALNLKVFNTITSGNDGYFACSAEQMIETLHLAFADTRIKAIFSVRGGFGCARLLPLLDWDLIKAHPKIVMGFSDITSLLIAINQRTGLVTFHGPSASMPWPQVTSDSLKKILFDGETMRFDNLGQITNDIIDHPQEIQILHTGNASGELIGGNLSVLNSLIGSVYLPQDWSQKILFLEDVHEEIYRLDRMLTQLKLANILPKIQGLIFGRFNHCPSTIPQSFSLMDVLRRVVNDLKIPVMANVMFGHQPEMFTFPIGAKVNINADEGYIKLLNPAVL